MEFARTLTLSLLFSITSILITAFFFVLFNLLIGRYVQSGVGVAQRASGLKQMTLVAAIVAVWLQNKVFPAYWIVPRFGHAVSPVSWGCLVAFCLNFTVHWFHYSLGCFMTILQREIWSSYSSVSVCTDVSVNLSSYIFRFVQEQWTALGNAALRWRNKYKAPPKLRYLFTNPHCVL